MTKTKVCVVPCSGMGKMLGSVAREIGFILAEDLCPDRMFLICIPSLSAEVGEHADMIKNNPVIVLDGCVEKCATKIALRNRARIESSFFLPRCIKTYGIKPKNRVDIGDDGRDLAYKVARDVAKEIKKLSQ